jgi:nucleotidyltransferase/DNA polymerase involved in DNA repair
MELLAKLTPKHPLSALPGIGRHTPRALAMYGVQTIGQFACFTYEEVESLLGISGKNLLKAAKIVR